MFSIKKLVRIRFLHCYFLRHWYLLCCHWITVIPEAFHLSKLLKGRWESCSRPRTQPGIAAARLGGGGCAGSWCVWSTEWMCVGWTCTLPTRSDILRPPVIREGSHRLIVLICSLQKNCSILVSFVQKSTLVWLEYITSDNCFIYCYHKYILAFLYWK